MNSLNPTNRSTLLVFLKITFFFTMKEKQLTIILGQLFVQQKVSSLGRFIGGHDQKK